MATLCPHRIMKRGARGSGWKAVTRLSVHVTQLTCTLRLLNDRASAAAPLAASARIGFVRCCNQRSRDDERRAGDAPEHSLYRCAAGLLGFLFVFGRISHLRSPSARKASRRLTGIDSPAGPMASSRFFPKIFVARTASVTSHLGVPCVTPSTFVCSHSCRVTPEHMVVAIRHRYGGHQRR
jgi:hypothetical protein